MHSVRFPDDRSVGKLIRMTITADGQRGEEDVCDLHGMVTIPDNAQLVVELDNTTDLSLLDGFHADDLFGLTLWKLFSIRDDELRHVGRLTGLRELVVLDAWNIGNPGIAHLAGLVNLEKLDLTESSITDVGLAHVGRFVKLRTLVLWGTQITDEGLHHIQSLLSLEKLNLYRTRVSDRGMPYLVCHRRLRQLDLRHTNVTASGIAMVQGSMPQCAVVSA